MGSVRMWERKAAGSDTWFGVARVGVGMTDLVESHAAMFAEPQDMPTDIEMEPVTGKVLARFHARPNGVLWADRRWSRCWLTRGMSCAGHANRYWR